MTALFGAREVVATDIASDAVQNAKLNCDRHGVSDRVTVLQGDLFAPASGRFDIVLGHPPVSQIVNERRGVSVEHVLCRFFRQLDDYLTWDGKALFSFASLGDQEMLARALKLSPLSWTVHREEMFGVEWELYESDPRSAPLPFASAANDYAELAECSQSARDPDGM